MSGGATGTASTTRSAPAARTSRMQAVVVAPVAMPSSTTSAVSSARSRGPVPAVALDLLAGVPVLAPGLALDVRLVDPEAVDHPLVQPAGAVAGDRANRQLRGRGGADLPGGDDVQRCPQRVRHGAPDREPAPRNRQHHVRRHPVLVEELREMSAGVGSVGEYGQQGAHPVARRRR